MYLGAAVCFASLFAASFTIDVCASATTSSVLTQDRSAIWCFTKAFFTLLEEVSPSLLLALLMLLL